MIHPMNLYDNWDYKKKSFKKKKLLIKNLNILFIITLILSAIYIPMNYCMFNFNIPFSTDGDNIILLIEISVKILFYIYS